MEENDTQKVPTYNYRETDFSVNRWMRKLGFVWTMDKPDVNFIGKWRKDGEFISQSQAVVMYLAIKRWWKFWL